MKKIAAMMVLGLLPLAGCANPQGASNGPYTAYDSDYDQGYDGYAQPTPYYGQPGYGPAPGASAYGPGPGTYGPAYPEPGNQGYYGQNYYGQSYSGQPPYGQPYGPTYRSSGYASSYYSPPPPPPPTYGPSSYYSTYYRCGCGR
jgi:hypothetical protein